MCALFLSSLGFFQTPSFVSTWKQSKARKGQTSRLRVELRHTHSLGLCLVFPIKPPLPPLYSSITLPPPLQFFIPKTTIDKNHSSYTHIYDTHTHTHHLLMSSLSSPFSSCFCPSSSSPPPPSSSNPNLTTYLYHTHSGLVSLTWSRSVLGRSLYLHIRHPHPLFHSPPSSSSSSSFHLHIKPFLFWKKQGIKKVSPNTHIFWNISKAKFGAGPEPLSGFYVAIVVDKKMVLVVGDASKEAYARSRAGEPQSPQFLVLKREHVVADRVYTTKAKFGGRMREIQIDCGCGHRDDSRICFSVDSKRVLQIKRLKWKFRGNERVEVDGVPIQISWDVYNWLFDKHNNDGPAIFVFKFEEEGDEQGRKEVVDRNLMNLWTQQNWNVGASEWGKVGKSLSSSSVSMSSSAGSFGASSSVLEWSSVEENELVVPTGFSLLVHAWRS